MCVLFEAFVSSCIQWNKLSPGMTLSTTVKWFQKLTLEVGKSLATFTNRCELIVPSSNCSSWCFAWKYQDNLTKSNFFLDWLLRAFSFGISISSDYLYHIATRRNQQRPSGAGLRWNDRDKANARRSNLLHSHWTWLTVLQGQYKHIGFEPSSLSSTPFKSKAKWCFGRTFPAVRAKHCSSPGLSSRLTPCTSHLEEFDLIQKNSTVAKWEWAVMKQSW